MKIDFLFPDLQIAVIQLLRHRVQAIIEIEVDEGRLLVLHLIQGWCLLELPTEIGELVIPPNLFEAEFLGLRLVPHVIEVERAGILAAVGFLFRCLTLLCGNPITMVRQSGKRMRTPDILEVHELVALFDQLSHRDRAMALLDTVTGLRRSELIGLKWLDVNFEDLELSVTRSVYRQRVGRCKTEISQKPVPLDPWVAEELLTWKLAAPYNQAKD
jgi:hypothetical protein